VASSGTPITTYSLVLGETSSLQNKQVRPKINGYVGCQALQYQFAKSTSATDPRVPIKREHMISGEQSHRFTKIIDAV